MQYKVLNHGAYEYLINISLWIWIVNIIFQTAVPWFSRNAEFTFNTGFTIFLQLHFDFSTIEFPLTYSCTTSYIISSIRNVLFSDYPIFSTNVSEILDEGYIQSVHQSSGENVGKQVSYQRLTLFQ